MNGNLIVSDNASRPLLDQTLDEDLNLFQSTYHSIISLINQMNHELSIINSSTEINKIKNLSVQYLNIQGQIKNLNFQFSKIKNNITASEKDKKKLIDEINLSEKSRIIEKNFNEISDRFNLLLDKRITQNTSNNAKNTGEEVRLELEEVGDKLLKNKFYQNKINQENMRIDQMNKEFIEIKNVTKQIKEISDLMISELNQQGNKMNLIEKNVIDVNKNLVKGNKELFKHENSLSKQNGLCCNVLGLFGLVVFFSFMFFVYYKR